MRFCVSVCVCVCCLCLLCCAFVPQSSCVKGVGCVSFAGRSAKEFTLLISLSPFALVPNQNSLHFLPACHDLVPPLPRLPIDLRSAVVRLYYPGGIVMFWDQVKRTGRKREYPQRYFIHNIVTTVMTWKASAFPILADTRVFRFHKYVVLQQELAYLL